MAGKRSRKLQVAPPEPPEDEELVHEYDRRHYQEDFHRARKGLDVQSSGTVINGRFVGCNGWDAARGPCTRFLLAWHRRAGKDREGLELIREESQLRVGSYWHLYPLQVQAERAIWHGVDPQTQTRLMDLVFGPPPDEAKRQGVPTLVAERKDQKLFMRLRNESTYQLCGSDNYDRLVGSNVLGCLFSEWALCDPRAWAYIMPILAENGGWAAFISTYRGRNHMYQMVQKLRLDPRWYVDVRTIDMTRRVGGNRVVEAADVEAERASLVAMHGRTRADAMIREEFYCDPMAALPGSIYGGAMANMLAEGRA